MINDRSPRTTNPSRTRQFHPRQLRRRTKTKHKLTKPFWFRVLLIIRGGKIIFGSDQPNTCALLFIFLPLSPFLLLYLSVHFLSLFPFASPTYFQMFLFNLISLTNNNRIELSLFTHFFEKWIFYKNCFIRYIKEREAAQLNSLLL